MKRLKISTGGQPIRPDDFKLVQDESLTGFIELAKALCEEYADEAIVSGLGLTNNGGGSYTIAAGYFYDGEELCRVAAFSYTYSALYNVYLVKAETDSDSRKFFDGTYRNVQTERTYVMQYATSAPANSFRYDSLNRLSSLLSVTPNLLDFQRTYSGYLTLNAGYTARDGGSGMYVLSNAYKDYQFMCAFTATVANGTICTLPAGHRPSVDLFFPFRAGSGWGLMLVKASTGNIQLTGAATAEGTYNYIQVETNINAVYPPIAIAHL